MDTIEIEGNAFSAAIVPFEHAKLLVITAPHGALGCGYISLDAAEKFGDAIAIVTGVSSYDDMLKAQVVRLSSAAAARGVSLGMTGREALLRMK